MLSCSSLDLIRALRPLCEQIARSSSDLADQLRRAATSVMLNLGEGEMGGRRGLLSGRQHDDAAYQASSLPGVQEHGTPASGFPRNLRDLCVSSSNNGRHPVDGARPRSVAPAPEGANSGCNRGSAE
jgi:hypothetical protein